MGMDSKKLSERAKQPGHDRTFTTSEQTFESTLRAILDPSEFEVEGKPRALSDILDGYGIQPEAVIRHKTTGRVMYFEVKKQGDRGNAEERAAKHHTVEFYRTLAAATGLPYHAYCTIFCESLATLDRYTRKIPFFFERGHYLLWANYDVGLLASFLDEYVLPRLRDSTTKGA